MMCFDLGGPVNKVAYAFAVAGLAAASPENTDALPDHGGGRWRREWCRRSAMALASTVLARDLFPPVERENGKAAWLLGAAFISEGAIPFAAARPAAGHPGVARRRRGDRRPRAWRSRSSRSRPTAASSCSSPSTPSGASWWRSRPARSSGALAVIALKKWVGRKELEQAEAVESAVPWRPEAVVRQNRRRRPSQRSTQTGEPWQNVRPPSRSSSGLHARPRSCSSRRCRRSRSRYDASPSRADADLNAGSILSLMGLGASQGTVVTLKADGDGAEQALDGTGRACSRTGPRRASRSRPSARRQRLADRVEATDAADRSRCGIRRPRSRTPSGHTSVESPGSRSRFRRRAARAAQAQACTAPCRVRPPRAS